MPLAASCPRCSSPVTGEPGRDFACDVHGVVPPLWRPAEVDYDGFAAVVGRSDLATYLPWPMSPGWSIADVGCVGVDGETVATVTTTVGTSDLDGEVEVTVVSEEPGVGLGARCAGTAYDDPGEQISAGPPAVRVRAEGRPVPLWLVDHEDHRPPATLRGGDPGEGLLERAVFVGETEGRWLWIVVRPASAALLMRDDWLLADVTGFGPEALEMPFGGPRPAW